MEMQQFCFHYWCQELLQKNKMLTQEQISEIKEHLSKAQNPLFFYDNDQDGLCACLLLQRYIGRGKGVAIRSFPAMTKDYFRKVEELNADYVFILDKPSVEKDFFNEVAKINLPVVWIDHHELQKKEMNEIPDFVNYYNPLYNKNPSNEPITALCYQITQKEDDLWIAVAGSISDKFYPNFYEDFKKQYPELAINSKEPFGILYKSNIGKVARIMGFALKDKTSNIVKMFKFLIKSKNPYDVLNENSENYFMHKRFEHIEKKYQKFLEKARESKDDYKNIIFFQYGGDTSISSDLANELSYEFPDKAIIVAYISGIKANISARGKGIREPILKVINEIDNATGGGHEDAVGAQVKIEDLEMFKKKVLKIIDTSD